MAYLGQRTFASFEKKARGWGDFFEEEEGEFTNMEDSYKNETLNEEINNELDIIIVISEELESYDPEIRKNALYKLNLENSRSAWELLLYTAQLNPNFDTRAEAGEMISKKLNEDKVFLYYVQSIANSPINIISDIAAKSLVVNDKKFNIDNYRNNLIQRVENLINDKQTIANHVVSTSMQTHTLYDELRNNEDAWVPSDLPRMGYSSWPEEDYDQIVNPKLNYLDKVLVELNDPKTDKDHLSEYGIKLGLMLENLGGAQKELDKMSLLVQLSGAWRAGGDQGVSYSQLYNIYYYHILLKLANDITGENPDKDKEQVEKMVSWKNDEGWQMAIAQAVYTDTDYLVHDLSSLVYDLRDNEDKYKASYKKTGDDASLEKINFFFRNYIDPMVDEVNVLVALWKYATAAYSVKNYEIFWKVIDEKLKTVIEQLSIIGGPFVMSAGQMLQILHTQQDKEVYSIDDIKNTRVKEAYDEIIEIMKIKDEQERNAQYDIFVESGSLKLISEHFQNVVIPEIERREKQEAEDRFIWDVVITIAACILTLGVGLIVRAGVAAFRAAYAIGRAGAVLSFVATSGAEGTVFFFSSRAMQSIILGDPFLDKDWQWEWLETVGLFAALKGAGGIYSKTVSRIKVPKGLQQSSTFQTLSQGAKTIELGQALTAYAFFEGWATGIFYIKNDKLPSSDEFKQMSKENALFLGMVHIGMLAAKPITYKMQSAFEKKVVGDFNKKAVEYENMIKNFSKEKYPTSKEAIEILNKAEKLLKDRSRLYESLKKEGIVTDEQYKIIKETIETSLELTKATKTIRELNIRINETNSHVGYYEGSSAKLNVYMEKLGYQKTMENPKTGSVTYTHPETGKMTMIRTSKQTPIERDIPYEVAKSLGYEFKDVQRDFWQQLVNNHPNVDLSQIGSLKTNTIIKDALKKGWKPGKPIPESIKNELNNEVGLNKIRIIETPHPEKGYSKEYLEYKEKEAKGIEKAKELGLDLSKKDGTFEEPSARGGRGADRIKGNPVIQIRELDYSKVRFTEKGVDVVEKHLSRFGPDGPNEIMIHRLRKIVKGEIHPTEYDYKFYTHELREYVRFRKGGYEEGMSTNEFYNTEHGATLEDYKIPDNPKELYHPDAQKHPDF